MDIPRNIDVVVSVSIVNSYLHHKKIEPTELERMRLTLTAYLYVRENNRLGLLPKWKFFEEWMNGSKILEELHDLGGRYKYARNRLSSF